MHDILKERTEKVFGYEEKALVKTLFNRERRKVYREIYNAIMRYDPPEQKDINT